MSQSLQNPLTWINLDRLKTTIEDDNIDVVIATSPESTYYLSGVFIRTQITIRDRLAAVVWPVKGQPVFIVCNIEESMARNEGWISDVRTYVEFVQSPITVIATVLAERGLSNAKVGIESRHLTQHYYDELRKSAPRAELVPYDHQLERVRAVKTPEEIRRISEAYLRTEEAIRAAWARARAGNTEKQVADYMLHELLERGADSLRHVTLSAAENTVHPHMRPGNRVLGMGDTLLTDFGGHFFGFSSDMARMGIVGEPTKQQDSEYKAYRAAYVNLLKFIRPGLTAADVFKYGKQQFQDAGLPFTFPHVGHSLTRTGGHENPILEPTCDQVLEPNMLLAVEPSFKPRPDRRYHIEDLVRVTALGAEVITDWESTAEMIRIGEQ